MTRRILIALPDGAVSDHDNFVTDGIAVLGARNEQEKAGGRTSVGIDASPPYGFPETVVTSLVRGQSELPDDRYLSIDLSADLEANESQEVRVTIPGLS